MARNRHDMAVRDSSIRPEGDCCGTDRVVGINSRQLSCLTNFLHHVVKFIDAERLVGSITRERRKSSLSGLLSYQTGSEGVEFGKIEFHSFVAIVWTVRFIYSCIFFRAAGIFQATGMVFRHFIVRHGHVISPARIDILWSWISAALVALRGLVCRSTKQYETRHVLGGTEDWWETVHPMILASPCLHLLA